MINSAAKVFASLCLTLFLICSTGMANGQVPSAASGSTTVPRIVRYAGKVTPAADGQLAPIQDMTFSFYRTAEDPVPLWSETQALQVTEAGNYVALIGATSVEGIPADVFGAEDAALWLGIRVGSGEEQRIQILSVPYAFRAGDADRLGGLPFSAFLLDPKREHNTRLAAGMESSTTTQAGSEISAAINGTGATNFLAKFSDASTVVPSLFFDTGSRIGLGTASPSRLLSVFDASASGKPFKVLQQELTNSFPAVEVISAGAASLDVASWDNSSSKWVFRAFRNASRAESDDIGSSGSPIQIMGIRSDGNIGIGTSFPSRRLMILDTTTFTRPFKVLQQNAASVFPAAEIVSAGTSALDVGNWDNTTSKWVLRAFRNGTRGDTNEDLASTGSPIQVFGVRSDGRVSVGTTDPSRKISIFDSSSDDRPFKVLQQNSSNPFAAAEIVSAGTSALDLANWDQAPSKWVLRAFSNASRAESDSVAVAGAPVPVFGVRADGNVGIGTSSPSAKLEVIDGATTQSVKVTNTAPGTVSFSVGTPPPVALRGDATSATGVTAGVLGISSAVLGRGVIGESLSTTQQNAGVYGVAVNSPDGTGVWGEATSGTGDAVGVFGRSISVTGTGVLGVADVTSTGDAQGVAGISKAIGGTGVQGEVTATSGENYGIAGRVFNNTTAGSTAGMFINTNTNAATGSLLLGRTSTAQGQANVFRVDTAGKGFFNGGTATTGADFAESVAVREDRAAYEPGDVIAIDTTGVRRFAKVAKAYSTLVAGIYSTKPGVLATPHHPEDPRIASEEIPLAVVGIVPCKVTNENGPIKAGDLLVASSKEGYAMKGTDRKRMNGAIIGKALDAMNKKEGVIEVLVGLQ